MKAFNKTCQIECHCEPPLPPVAGSRRSFPAVYSLVLLLMGLAGFMPSRALSQETKLIGKWASSLGVIRIHQKGNRVQGKLIWVSKTCPFHRGDKVLEGILLEDSLSGKWRYCLKGNQCKGDQWAPLVMLVARGSRVLSGAAHYKTTACQIGGKRKGNGVVVRKLRRTLRPPKQSPLVAQVEKKPTFRDEDGKILEEEIKPLDPKNFQANQTNWQQCMQEGKTYLDRGFFERARKKFKNATRLDPTRPEAFNGVGVTYYARGDYQEALRWYKQALEVNPDFQDAFYNLACIYSLMKKNQLAFRYLNIALLNGYVEHEAMEQDADLENLRSDPRFIEILQKMKKNDPNRNPRRD